MQLEEIKPATWFVQGARITFGTWLLYTGLWKWISGPTGFVAWIVSDFSKTWSPEILNTTLAWTILVAEPAFSLWILSGFKARLAWTATAALLFMLTFGKTLQGDFATVANNWQYLILALACAALSEGRKN